MINVQYESLDFRKSSLDQKNWEFKKKWEFKNILVLCYASLVN